MSKYALFVYEPHEAGGGANDLALIGSFEECKAHYEAHGDMQDAHIALLETLQIVCMAKWKYEQSPLVSRPGTYSLTWVVM